MTFHLRDYRHEAARYDRIVSVGMFEHVSTPHYRTYFNAIANRLTDDGMALVHTIGISGRPGAPGRGSKNTSFRAAMSEVVPAIEKNGLIVTDVEVLRLHYVETLRARRPRFLANRVQLSDFMMTGFAGCRITTLPLYEAPFRHTGLVVFQFQLAKLNATVPLTRDYIANAKVNQLHSADADRHGRFHGLRPKRCCNLLGVVATMARDPVGKNWT